MWTQNTHISVMPPKKKPRHDISGLKKQPKLTTDSCHIMNKPMTCASDTTAPPVSPDPQINNNTDDEEWTPNLPFDSNKPVWNDKESEDNIDSENEEDFLDKIVEEEMPGVNPRKYRNKSWYVALMRIAIEVGNDLLDEDWVPKKMRKKLDRKSVV